MGGTLLELEPSATQVSLEIEDLNCVLLSNSP